MFIKFEGALYVENYIKNIVNFRIIGTLGHPILYTILLTSSLPIIIIKAKNKYFKLIYCAIATFTILLAKSTTGFLMLITLIFGYLIIKNERKYYIAFFIILLIIGGFFISNPNFEINIGKTVFSLQRIILGNPVATDYRVDQIKWAIEHFKNDGIVKAIFGNGTHAAIRNITKEIGPLMGTQDIRPIDNSYFTLLYDNGILGLIVYFMVFISPLFTILKKYSNKLLWWSLFAFILAGVSTDTYFYSTINFIFILTWILMEKPEQQTIEEEMSDEI
jgi:O-antigen ligase